MQNSAINNVENTLIFTFKLKNIPQLQSVTPRSITVSIIPLKRISLIINDKQTVDFYHFSTNDLRSKSYQPMD